MGNAAIAALAVGLVVGGAGMAWLRDREVAEAGRSAGAQERIAQLEARLIALETQQRNWASLAPHDPGAAVGADPGTGHGAGQGAPAAKDAPAGEGEFSYHGAAHDAGIGGKPLDAADAAAMRRTGVDDSAMARALEKADRISSALQSEARQKSVLDAAADGVAAALPDAAPIEPPNRALAGAKEEAPALPPEYEPVVLAKAFNALLKDAGLDGWYLMGATAAPDDKALSTVTLARRGARGVAIGSLVADRLTLDRDPITGVAAFVATGAHGIEEGMEVHYEGARYRIEIPGVLPIELVPAELRRLFALGAPLVADSNLEGSAAVTLVNRALALEPGVMLRLREIEKLDGERLKKAVFDLEFDDSGKARQSVMADAAWFELDPAARYGELCCEGGEMVENGVRRPLFRGHLRVPLRDLTPEHWKGVPAVQRVTSR